MPNRITKVFAIFATEKKGCSPDDFLYGSFDLAFYDREEAEEQLTVLETEEAFGVEGDKVPAEVGITYRIVKIEADFLDNEEPEDYESIYDIPAHVASAVAALLQRQTQ